MDRRHVAGILVLAAAVAGLLVWVVGPDTRPVPSSVIVRPSAPAPEEDLSEIDEPVSEEPDSDIPAAATISGAAVFEDSGDTVPGVTVQFYNQFTSKRVETTTDEHGRYTLANLAAPEHGVEVNMSAKTGLEGWRAELEGHPNRVFNGQQVADVNFTLVRNTSSISGTVFAKDVVWHSPRIRTLLPALNSDFGRSEAQKAWQNVRTEELEPLAGARVILAYPGGDSKPVGATIAETVSGEDGGYTFEYLAPGNHLVYVAPPISPGQSVPEGLVADRQSVKLEDGEHKTGVDLSIGVDAVTVSGSITNRDGNPIPRAKVTAEPLLIPDPSGGGGARIRTHAIQTVSDANGKYSINGLIPATFQEVFGHMRTGNSLPVDGRTYRIVARAPGYAPAHVLVPSLQGETVRFATALIQEMLRTGNIHPNISDLTHATDNLPDIHDNEITQIDIVLDHATTVSGHLHDTRGNLLPDVRIRLVFAEELPQPPSAFVQRASALDWVTTNPDAFFLISAIPAGEYYFEIDTDANNQRARNEPLRVVSGGQYDNVAVVVEAEAERGSIEGKIVTPGAGLPVTEFNLQLIEIESPTEPSPRVGTWTFDKEAGAFTIEGISPGRASLLLEAPGYGRETLQVEVKPGEITSIHIALAPEGVLRGHMYINGEPSAYGTLRYAKDGASGYIRADENGYYEEKGMKEGNYLVSYTFVLYENQQDRAWIIERRWLEIAAGQETQVDMDFHGDTVIQGTFDGPPSEKWGVRLYDDALPGDDKLRAGTWSFKEDGRYEIAGLPAGTYTVVGVSIDDEGGETEQAKTVTIGEGEILTIDFLL